MVTSFSLLMRWHNTCAPCCGSTACPSRADAFMRPNRTWRTGKGTGGGPKERVKHPPGANLEKTVHADVRWHLLGAFFGKPPFGGVVLLIICCCLIFNYFCYFYCFDCFDLFCFALSCFLIFVLFCGIYVIFGFVYKIYNYKYINKNIYIYMNINITN